MVHSKIRPRGCRPNSVFVVIAETSHDTPFGGTRARFRIKYRLVDCSVNTTQHNVLCPIAYYERFGTIL